MLKIFFISFIILLISCDRKSIPLPDSDTSSELVINEKDKSRAENLYDEESLLTSLNMIEKFHIEHETGLVLNNKASKESIFKAEEKFGCKIPHELKVMWGWRNGEQTDYFIWYHRFLSIEDSLKEYDYLVTADYSTWNTKWIPIFEFQEEWYGVECSTEQLTASPIIFYFTESGESVAYANLTTYMQTMAEAINHGVLLWGENGWSEITKGIEKIHALKNPDIPFAYYIEY